MSQIVAGKECVRGVDISRWQGKVNYAAFNLDFAYIKASGGDGGLYRDSTFKTNSQYWLSPWGPYHFASQGAFAAEVEADYYCDIILSSSWASLPANMKLPPVLDWEPERTVPNSAQWVLTFLKRVESRTGMRPMIYTGAYVALDRVQELTNYDLWLAAYTQSPPPCAPWGSNWSVWQYSSTGHADGISGGVDSNAATVEWFNRVRQGGSTPPQPPTPPQEEALMVTDDDARKIEEIVKRVVSAELQGQRNVWIGRNETNNNMYLVTDYVKYHIPDPHQVDILTAIGVTNKGNQGAALDSLPEQAWQS